MTAKSIKTNVRKIYKKEEKKKKEMVTQIYPDVVNIPSRREMVGYGGGGVPSTWQGIGQHNKK